MDSGQTIDVLGHRYIRVIAAIASYVGHEDAAGNAAAKSLDTILASARPWDLEVSIGSGTDLVVAARGWTESHDQAALDNAARIGALERAGATHDGARLDELELRTGGVAYDDATAVWQAVDEAANPAGEKYGKFILYPGGLEIRNYSGGDYGEAHVASWSVPHSTPWNLDDVGVVWVVSNASTWSRLRLAVRSADGELRQAVSAGALHTVSGSVRIANAPATGYTALWIGADDTHPQPLGHLAVGDTITIERQHPLHRPIWTDEVSGPLVGATIQQVLDLAYPRPRWQFAQPDSGAITVDFDSNAGRVPGHRLRNVVDITEDYALRDQILAARELRIPTRLEVEFDLDLYYWRELGAGTVITLGVSLGISSGGVNKNVVEFWQNAGVPTWDAFTIAEFGRAHVRHPGAYAAAPDVSARVQRNLDTSGWDLPDGSKFVIDLFANNVSGFARMKVALPNLRMRLVTAHDTSLQLSEIVAQTAPFLVDLAAVDAVISAAWTIPERETSRYALGTPATQIEIPKNLPAEYHVFRVEARVENVVVHAVTVPIGDYGSWVLAVSAAQSVKFSYDRGAAAVDTMVVRGNGTTLPLNARVVVYIARW